MSRLFRNGRMAAAASAAVLAVAIGQPASATTVDFDDWTGSTALTKTEKLSVLDGNETVATISGGQVLDLNDGNVYSTDRSGKCSGCKSKIIVNFETSVNDPSLILTNMTTQQRKYYFWINGAKVGSDFISGGTPTKITFPGTGIVKIRVSVQPDANKNVSTQFNVDDVTFGEDPGYTVSVRAFIPGNNVPAAQDVFCVALPEMTVDGTTRAPTVVRGASASLDAPERRRIYVAGDDDGESYRALQSVSVVPDQDMNDSGYVDTSVVNEVTDMIAFADNSLLPSGDTGTDRISSSAWAEMEAGTGYNGGDCYFYHKTYLQSDANMNVTPGRDDAKSVSVNFSGIVDTPLGGRSGKDAIDWNLTVTVDAEKSWTVKGTHVGFPAFEVMIGDELVYSTEDTIGMEPYTFVSDVRTPMRTSVQVHEKGVLN